MFFKKNKKILNYFVILNSHNLEEKIFFNTEFQRFFPRYDVYFKQWKLAVVAGLHHLKTKIFMDFLNQITDEQLKVLEVFFKEKITITKLDYHIVRFFNWNLDELEIQLNNSNINGELLLHRTKDKISICNWI